MAVLFLLASGVLGSHTSVKVVKIVVVPRAAKSVKAKAQQASDAVRPASAEATKTSTAEVTGLKHGSTSSFAAFERLHGQVGIAVLPVGSSQIQTLGDDAAAHGWSTTKVPVLLATMLATQPAGLSVTQKQEADLAITQSNNQAILDLFGSLETLKGGLLGASQYVQQLFRESGDDITEVATAPPPPDAATTFGQTEWSPSESVKFFAAFAHGCLSKPAITRYVLGLMENIEPSERWGFGEARLSVPVAFKDGWGPEPSGAYLVRQSAIIDPGTADAVAVSIVAYPPPGGDSFGEGEQMVTDAARWVTQHLTIAPHTQHACQTPASAQ